MISDWKSRYKSWSDLRKRMDGLLCEALKGRITYFFTRFLREYMRSQTKVMTGMEQGTRQELFPAALCLFQKGMAVHRKERRPGGAR